MLRRAAAALALAALAGGALAAPHEHPVPAQLAPGYAALEFTPPRPGTYALPALGVAADGPVLNAAGEAGTLHALMGDKVVVLSFIYTRCGDVNGCPLAGYVLKGLQDRLLPDPVLRERVRLLSFSFDPAHDTPAVLRDYAARLRNPAFDWQFLTTASEPALDPTLAAYDQWVVRDYGAKGEPLGTISHLLRVYLIDTDLRIRNIYSVSYLHADTVANDIRTLLLEKR